MELANIYAFEHSKSKRHIFHLMLQEISQLLTLATDRDVRVIRSFILENTYRHVHITACRHWKNITKTFKFIFHIKKT